MFVTQQNKVIQEEKSLTNFESPTINHTNVLRCVEKHDGLTADQISKILELHRTEIYSILTILQNMKLISSKLSTPTKYFSTYKIPT